MPAYHPFLKISKTIKLPEYGYVGITELEQSIIDTYYFQRLRRIRQSPGVSLVYPGASHTRFEHSLGAMHLAGEAAIHLILNSKHEDTKPVIEYFKTENDKKKISQLLQISRLGALLHDVGHGPLSHTFEYFLKLCDVHWHHENLSMEVIYTKLKQFFNEKNKNPYNVDVRHVISLLCDIKRSAKKISIKDNTKSFLKSIGLDDGDISFMEEFLSKNWFLNYIIKEDPYNVDRFNYLILDSNRSGAVEYGSIDFQRLIQNLYIHDNAVIVSLKAKDAAVRFFEAYSHMYRSVYLHKVSYGADLHLAYAMYLASEEEPSSIFGSLRKRNNINDILPLSDDVLLYYLNQIKNEKCRKLIEDFLERKIMSRVYETESSEFRKLLIEKGKDGVIAAIKKKSGLSDDTIIRVASVEEKKASPPPFTKKDLARVSFLNLDNKKTEPIDNEIIQVLSPKEIYRVYTVNKYEVKRKVKEAAMSLVS